MENYNLLLTGISNYLRALKSDGGIQQLERLDEHSRLYWETYIENQISSIVEKSKTFVLLKIVNTLNRMTMALLQENDIYIGTSGEIIADNYKTSKNNI